MTPRRILMTTDAVGGVWRYALDLARGLQRHDVETVLLGFGPRPNRAQQEEAARFARLEWSDLPLDWTARSREELAGVQDEITAWAEDFRVDVVQVNAPAQAARLGVSAPIVAAAHSCVTTWFRAVRGGDLPPAWAWRRDMAREGFAASSMVVAPTRAFARLLFACHPGLPQAVVAPNASAARAPSADRRPFAYAAARWWDEGKNAAALDAAAGLCRTPVFAAGAVDGPNGTSAAFRSARGLGQLDANSVADLGATAQVFVSPSIYEPFGLAALEAARLGAALVLSDIPTYRELWSGAALFVDPHDPAAIGDAIDRLVADDSQRETLARAAARRAAAFTVEAQAERMLSLYRAAVRSRDRRGAA